VFADYDARSCADALPGKTNVAIIGDSMAADIYLLLSQAYPEVHFLQATAGACPGLVDKTGFGQNYPACADINTFRFSGMLEQKIDLVVLASLWGKDRIPALKKTVAYLHERGLPVLIFGPKNVYHGRVPLLLAKETTLEGINGRLASHVKQKRATLQAMREALPDVEVIDMHTIQCVPDCIAVEGERLLYLDAIHFTVLGARRMAERFRARYDLEAFLNLGS
jgi:hypothetical protein